MICPGDIFLSKPVMGFRLVQEAICWWTDSGYSHAEIAIDNLGNSIDFRWPTTASSNVLRYFDGKHRVLILRPVFTFDPRILERSLTSKLGAKYALREYLGFVTNKRIADSGQWHCGSGNLAAYQDAGGLVMADRFFVTPQTFVRYAEAGAFEVVARLFGPDPADFKGMVERTNER